MADVNEPKKETVRIDVPPPPALPPGHAGELRDDRESPEAATAADVNVKSPDLPGLGQRPLPPPPPGPPASEKPAAETPAPSPFPAPPPPAPPSPGPKKETARIEFVPEPRLGAAKGMTSKTQPLIMTPAPSAQGAPVLVAPQDSRAAVDSIPMPLCWALLAVSAITFIIQLWTYFS